MSAAAAISVGIGVALYAAMAVNMEVVMTTTIAITACVRCEGVLLRRPGGALRSEREIAARYCRPAPKRAPRGFDSPAPQKLSWIMLVHRRLGRTNCIGRPADLCGAFPHLVRDARSNARPET